LSKETKGKTASVLLIFIWTSCFIIFLYGFLRLPGNWNVARNPGNYQDATINSNNEGLF